MKNALTFKTVSMTGTGIVVELLLWAVEYFNLTVGGGEVEAGVKGLFAFLGLAFIIVGQVRRKDMKFGLVRK